MHGYIFQNSAMLSTHEGWGTAVVIGVVKYGENVEISPLLFLMGRTWKGSIFGGLYFLLYP